MTVTVEGAEPIRHYVRQVELGLGSGQSLQVGFLDGAKYPDGTSVPMVAMIQEYGGTINREASTVTVYRKVNAAGTDFLKNGRFVKRKDANFSQTYDVPPYTITIPPRPFFRTAVEENSDQWPRDAAELLREHDFDLPAVAKLMGEKIKGQVQQSIIDWLEPPNAPSTISKKGFDKPLIDTGVMLRSVDYTTE
jgi:hypothetical protein